MKSPSVKTLGQAVREVQRGKTTTTGTPFIPAFRANGSVMNLADLKPEDVDFATMARSLAKQARFNGVDREPIAYSVAQHSVMGADALFQETGDTVLAGYFLLHDGHEWILSDIVRPVVQLLDHVHAIEHARRFPGSRDGLLSIRKVLEASAARIDTVIHAAANLRPLSGMPLYQRQVREMDERMLRAEGLALFGPNAAPHLPAADLPKPKLVGAIRSWGAAKAEEAFVDRLERYLGIVVSRWSAS